jgi:hypothetical protein
MLMRRSRAGRGDDANRSPNKRCTPRSLDSMSAAGTIELFVVTRKGEMASLPMPNDDYLDTLREFIDFINRQAGVYMDAIAGFAGNKVRFELQVARVRRRFPGGRDTDGANIVVSTSLEDPHSPDVILNRISRAKDYITDNSERGYNEQQQARAIIVFVFAYWDEEIRPRLARAKNLASTNEIRVDVMGDLRLLRQSIIHNKGNLVGALHHRLKVMQDLFVPEISHDSMHQVFIRLKQGIGGLILDHIGRRPGAPDVDEIKDVAIQRTNSSR